MTAVSIERLWMVCSYSYVCPYMQPSSLPFVSCCCKAGGSHRHWQQQQQKKKHHYQLEGQAVGLGGGSSISVCSSSGSSSSTGRRRIRCSGSEQQQQHGQHHRWQQGMPQQERARAGAVFFCGYWLVCVVIYGIVLIKAALTLTSIPKYPRK